ncbi:ABC transporter permease [Kallotenue papyrolyticum]|uniref:ABC transporter permease n=1 Tax=Kallotenue papyrolyticum TaxID=1325125 RepID=UPI0004785943|nr:ABC transporter permease [Kallotenue papyrolyticum]
MTTFIIRRLLWFIPVLLIVGLVTFAIARMTPGGPFDRDPSRRQLPPRTEELLRQRFGLDLPLWRQFVRYMFFDIETNPKTGKREIRWGAIAGNFGPTYASRGARTVQQELFKGTSSRPSRFYYSARLGIQALLLALMVGVPIGVLAALKQNSWLDYLSLLWATSFVALGTLVISLLLVIIFAVGLKWFNVIPDWNEPIKPWILPTIALGAVQIGYIARLTRASVLEVKRQDYVRTAMAKGLSRQAVVWRHIVRNALIPVITVLGPLLAGLITGTLFVELIFQVPGMGLTFVQAIGKRDYSMIMGSALLFTFFLNVGNLLVDILYGVVDPRITFK